jgi:hypothetical protein
MSIRFIFHQNFSKNTPVSRVVTRWPIASVAIDFTLISFLLELHPHTYIYFYWRSTHTLIPIYIVVIGLDQLLQLDHCSIGNLFYFLCRQLSGVKGLMGREAR